MLLFLTLLYHKLTSNHVLMFSCHISNFNINFHNSLQIFSLSPLRPCPAPCIRPTPEYSSHRFWNLSIIEIRNWQKCPSLICSQICIDLVTGQINHSHLATLPHRLIQDLHAWIVIYVTYWGMQNYVETNPSSTEEWIINASPRKKQLNTYFFLFWFSRHKQRGG